MFGINGWEMVALAVVALLIFGPDKLPKAAADATRFIRQMRTMIAGARRDLSESLGPEFEDLDISDLNPRSFVRKQLLEPLEVDLDDVDGVAAKPANGQKPKRTSARSKSAETAPFDPDAT